MLEEVGAGELTEWVAFAELEPFGGAVEDLRAGLGPAVTVNMNRTEDAEPVTALDFYAWHKDDVRSMPSVEPESPEVLAAKLRAMLSAKGKRNGNV